MAVSISDDNGQSEPELSKSFVEMIDKAVTNDFIVKEITDDDRKNDFYQSLKFTLTFNQIKVLYERKVLTALFILPKVQYLFGFKPKEGLCLLVNKKVHKHVLCDGPLAELNEKCFLINSLQFLLVQSDAFKVWSYVPACSCDKACANTPKALELRTKLYIEKDADEK